MSEIAFFKAQQWSVANYSLLAYAGVVATGQLIPPTSYMGIALVCSCVAILGAGFAAIVSLSRAIEVRRQRLLYVRACNLITEVFRQAWEAKLKEPEIVSVDFALKGALVLGFSLSVFVIYFGK